ncbi:unnamed protein product [Protopolystoma xenopodis]|uniref:26S proteasome complex subunit SEM1 n=1 Tax=Protopolystoma xenopodis TaxID=117903 RepID=A0A448WE53_9PLAT|nr:unnamed protein product [Protopolystoma xenopodis]
MASPSFSEASEGGPAREPGQDVEDFLKLKDDNEFEEFDTENWSTFEEDHSDLQVWSDAWDDDNVEDGFTAYLSDNL